VRWEALFADLEAQLEAAGGGGAGEGEHARAEAARTCMADRWRAHTGVPLRVRLVDGSAEDGTVAGAGPAWLLLADGGSRVLVPAAAIATVGGLSRAAAPPPSEVERRLGLNGALRAVARDRTPVRLRILGAAATGTIDRVGADHLDLAEHPLDAPRRPSAVREVLTVPLAALLSVRSAPW
jgi:hypothetical protein